MTEQEEFEFRRRLEEEQAAAQANTTAEADQVNPLYGALGGAFAGQVAGPAINQGVAAVRSGAPGAAPAPGSASGAAPGQKFAAKTGYGSGPGFTVEDVVEHKKAQEKPIGKGKITKNIPGNSPMNVDKMLQLEAAQKAEAARRAAALGQGASSLPGPVQAAGRFIGGAAQSGVAPYVGRSLAGAGAGFQGADAYNRFQQGDIPGAAISGIGALGSAASFVPTPVTRIGGAAVGVGAELLNQYLDSLKKKVEGMGAPAAAPAPVQAPLSAPAPQGMAKGGKVLNQLKKLHEVLAKDEGKYLLGTMADRTKATEGFKGGPGFINLNPDYTWAVDAPAVAKKHMEAVERFGGPDRTIMAPMLMSREAHKSNRPVFEQIYNDAQQRIKSGEVTPEQIAALNNRIRVEKAVDLSKNPGIENPEFLEFASAFNRRGKLADIMGLKKSGIVDLQKHLDSTIDPALREASTGSVGPQTFTMTGYREAPGIHPGYNIGFTGDKGSDMFEPAPREFLFRELESQAMKQMGRPMTDYNYRNVLKEHGGIPNQLIDEKLLRSLQELGYAKGGKVGALTNLLKHVEQQMGKLAALRVEKAADLVPNLERKYSESALRKAFAGDNNRPLMIMQPSKFEEYATPAVGKEQAYLNQLQKIANGVGFNDVPYLQLSKNAQRVPEITGHEGRHRSAALAQMGDDPSLVRLMPTSAMDADIPRNKMIGDYLSAWEQQHGQNILVKPESYYDDLKKQMIDRKKVKLPETFKKGGLATLKKK